MTDSTDATATPPPASPGTPLKQEPAPVRVGRLAGGAVLAAWILSVFYHVVLFIVMYAVPWLAEMAMNPADGPAPVADLVNPVQESRTTLSPWPEAELTKRVEELERLQFEPDRFQPMEALSPNRPEQLDILGIGTSGGEAEMGSYSIPFRGAGPDFFGLGSQARGARNIVYVVDRSGSMLTTFAGVVRELRESISGLRRSQRFHVIFFNSGQPLEKPPRRMVSAVRAHKRAAFKFFGTITPSGDTDPRPALRRAFAVEPDLIYFLTDGEFNERARSTLDLLDKMNRRRNVRIFTIAYVNQQGAAVLERIAREHNGEYRFVSEDEIF